MAKIYNSFDEVEADIKVNAPAVVYKVRTWKDENHKRLLRDQQVWFSHPFDLNDPLDARPSYRFDSAEIETAAFYERLVNGAPSWQELGVKTEDEFQEKCRQQWDKIKQNPQVHFDANRKKMLVRERFDPIGILSTSTNGTNAQTWDMYGDNFAGYAVGFNTAALA